MIEYDNQNNRVKESPKSQEAEQAVIGALLLDNDRWDDVADYLIADDFFFQNNRLIFQVMSELSLRNEPFDVLTIGNLLRENEAWEQMGGGEYLRQLAMETPSASNVIVYAKIVREQAIKRKLIAAAGDIANSAYFPEGRDARSILDNAEQKIFNIAEMYQKNTRDGLQSIKKAAAETLHYIEELSKLDSPITGISTGFVDLDRETAGLQRGDLIIVGGRPSMGKTSFAMNIAESVAIGSGLPVAIFSLEMPARSLVMRLIASLARVDNSRLRLGKIKTNEEMSKFTYALHQLNQAPIFIDDGGNISVHELRARVRRLKREQGELGLVLIDYLQLMQMPDNSENRATQMGDISRALKLLAKEMDVPVIALSQLNRASEKRMDQRPVMSDIRESGAIEQDADVIMFVYRDEVYHKNRDDNKGLAEIIIGKQRNGPIGTVKLAFRGEFTRFDDYSDREMPDWEN